MMNSVKKINPVRWYMKSTIIIISLISVLLLPSGVQAVQMLSGNQVVVDSPIDDDIFVSGGTVDINAPVAGAVIAGGNININAPVNGDVFVAGGQISINSDIRGKIVAAGGNIDLKGNAKNVIIAAGNVNIQSTAVINKDAVIAGGSVNNAGRINGNLTVRAENFQNTGSAGSVDFRKREGFQGLQLAISVLVTIGFLILGIILLKIFPAQFFKVEEEARKSTIVKTVVGFVLIIAFVVVIILLAVTIVGLPVAAIIGMLFIIALMLSTFFVSFAVGRKIVDLLKFKANDVLIFILGFIVLNILFRIPYAGGLIQIVAISLGFGAIYYALRENWKSLT